MSRGWGLALFGLRLFGLITVVNKVVEEAWPFERGGSPA